MARRTSTPRQIYDRIQRVKADTMERAASLGAAAKVTGNEFYFDNAARLASAVQHLDRALAEIRPALEY